MIRVGAVIPFFFFFELRRDEINCVKSETRGLISDLNSSLKDVRTWVMSGVGGD